MLEEENQEEENLEVENLEVINLNQEVENLREDLSC